MLADVYSYRNLICDAQKQCEKIGHVQDNHGDGMRTELDA